MDLNHIIIPHDLTRQSILIIREFEIKISKFYISLLNLLLTISIIKLDHLSRQITASHHYREEDMFPLKLKIIRACEKNTKLDILHSYRFFV
jgi:isocitrate dehydrogenase kinase/phosphatase